MWRRGTGEAILSIRSVTIDSRGAKVRAELLDRAGEGGIFQDASLDLADRVDDGGVVSAVEGGGDLREGEIGELAAEVHGELAGTGDWGDAAG